MAARIRASFADDDSLSEHLTLEMVRIDAPPTTSSVTHTDLDEQMTLNESEGTMASSILPIQNNFLINTNPTVLEGINREYETPNLFTYRKVIGNCACLLKRKFANDSD